MPLTRRHFLLAGTAAPLLTACASDLSRYRDDSVDALATRIGVGAAVFATCQGGQALPPTAVGGGGAESTVHVDAVFQAASLTKPVVAFAALQLARSGQLDLRAPVATYLPHGYVHYHNLLRQSPGDPSDTVAVGTLARMPVATLLNHTSGLPNWTRAALAPDFEPGTQWRYSGEGYGLLQAVLEAVTGTRITALMDAQVFQPLGMRDSSLVWQPRLADRAVHGESATGTPAGVRFHFPAAAASLYTTAADYMRFLSAFAANDALVSLALSQPVDVDRALGLAWGYGWGIEHTGDGPHLWQWGNNPGFRAFAMFSARSRDGFVLFTNHERGMALAVPLAQQTLPVEHPVFRFGMLG